MKLMIKRLTFALTTALLLAAPVSKAAEPIMIEEGPVLAISSSSVNINDLRFRLSPTVKITLKNKKTGALKDVKKGDYARISVFKFNNRKLVDSIELLNGPATN